MHKKSLGHGILTEHSHTISIDSQNLIQGAFQTHLQKMNKFSDWSIATGLEHTVKYLKPVKPDVKYQVSGLVTHELTWKNPKYTHLKMSNTLMLTLVIILN